MCRREIQKDIRSRSPIGRGRGLKILTVWVRIPSRVPLHGYSFHTWQSGKTLDGRDRPTPKNIEDWCNGNTTDFDSVVGGSTPSSSAIW